MVLLSGGVHIIILSKLSKLKYVYAHKQKPYCVSFKFFIVTNSCCPHL